MIVFQVALAACLASGPDAARQGVIEGVVRNSTDGNKPAGWTAVVLRATVEGRTSVAAETTADAHGIFAFGRLPVDPTIRYLPGANRHGVHYPGGGIRLTAKQPRARLVLTVCDAVTEPSPLVIRSHEVLLRSEPGAIRVTETLLVENPSRTCYVGQPLAEGQPPITLQLSIPAAFERATFDEEFYGRRFFVANHKPVTDIPWTPGSRELKFTYVVPNRQAHYVWERPLDLPCRQLQVRVHNSATDVSSNLPQVARDPDIVFQAKGPLPPGHVVRVELGRLPVPWMAYARWIALALLLTLFGSVGWLSRRRRTKPSPPAPHLPARRHVSSHV